jgi:hypothetical protein
MDSVTNTIRILGQPAAVFDLVTTTRFWPQWHPATTGVGGVTERPFLPGERIRERAQIGTRTYEGTWQVIEYDRPQRVVLRGESGRIQITYTFAAAAEAVQFSRQLTYYPEDFAASVPDLSRLSTLMHVQSEQALQKLKILIEQILHAEQTLLIQTPEKG